MKKNHSNLKKDIKVRPNRKKDRSTRRTRGNFEPNLGVPPKKLRRSRSKYRPTPGYKRDQES